MCERGGATVMQNNLCGRHHLHALPAAIKSGLRQCEDGQTLHTLNANNRLAAGDKGRKKRSMVSVVSLCMKKGAADFCVEMYFELH